MPVTDEDFVGTRIAHSHDLDSWVKETSAIAAVEKVKAFQKHKAYSALIHAHHAAIGALETPYRDLQIYPLPTAYAAPTSEQVEARFNALADQWESDTAFMSAIDTMVLHQSYQDIIGMGSAALPFIFKRLHKSPARWFWALRSIVGHDVAEGATSSQDAADRWLGWGVANGYVFE